MVDVKENRAEHIAINSGKLDSGKLDSGKLDSGKLDSGKLDLGEFSEIYDQDSIDQNDECCQSQYRPFNEYHEIDDVNRTMLMPDFIG